MNVSFPPNVLGVVKKTISNAIGAYRYRGKNGYHAERYWKSRLARHGLDMKGVGNEGLSAKENKEDYSQAKSVFLELCAREHIDFKTVSVLDVGCGNGFYADILRGEGVRHYTGIDITDTLFEQLHVEFPEFSFETLDVSTQELSRSFDMVIMIDVTQHVTNKKKFSFAMQNIRKHLPEGGVFVVTSWLNKNMRHSFYEISKSLGDFEREFPGYTFSQPFAFRDKYIFSIKRR